MDMVANFINAVESRVDDTEKKESFVGFAKDAQKDPMKMKALDAFMNMYMRSDGSFDPAMYENPSYVLFDLYDDVLNQ